MTISIERTNDFNTIQEIRDEIFGKELRIPKNDIFDKEDEQLDQFLILHDGKSIGTFRLKEDGNAYKIERMGILPQYRSKGFGMLALEKIKNYSKQNNKTKIILDSIYEVKGFYAKSGFIQIGGKYSKVNIPHVHMYLEF